MRASRVPRITQRLIGRIKGAELGSRCRPGLPSRMPPSNLLPSDVAMHVKTNVPGLLSLQIRLDINRWRSYSEIWREMLAMQADVSIVVYTERWCRSLAPSDVPEHMCDVSCSVDGLG